MSSERSPFWDSMPYLWIPALILAVCIIGGLCRTGMKKRRGRGLRRDIEHGRRQISRPQVQLRPQVQARSQVQVRRPRPTGPVMNNMPRSSIPGPKVSRPLQPPRPAVVRPPRVAQHAPLGAVFRQAGRPVPPMRGPPPTRPLPPVPKQIARRPALRVKTRTPAAHSGPVSPLSDRERRMMYLRNSVVSP